MSDKNLTRWMLVWAVLGWIDVYFVFGTLKKWDAVMAIGCIISIIVLLAMTIGAIIKFIKTP